ncbi:MAG: NitT/TauT family transport system ATP-binding protein [Halanaerobium sp.]|nr:MAG: NitT/TauT family transport system ATP-binding protein [Halanaerobium sp.]
MGEFVKLGGLLLNQIIKLKGINKTFLSQNNSSIKALKNINLNIADNEFVCLIGPSGSGKSTLLRLMAGLVQPTKGKLEVMGRNIKKPIKEAAMVFQQYSLLPWRNIIENVAFGLEIRGVAKEKRYKIANNILKKFGLKGFNESYPYELSGGMKQRVAIAKAIAISPEIIYMDEPFGALDAFTRTKMQNSFKEYWVEDRKTIVFVTHSVEEAVFLGTRVIVMSARPGRIIGDYKIDLPYARDKWNSDFGQYVKKFTKLINANSK